MPEYPDNTAGTPWLGAFDAGTAYKTGDVVSHSGLVYQAADDTTGSTPLPGGTTLVEDTDGSIVFTGSGWATDVNVLEHGGTQHYTNHSTDYATITFTGVGIAIWGTRQGNFGNARYALDGGGPVTASQYGAGSTPQQLLWSSGALSPGSHTLVITCLGTHESSASDNYVGLDYYVQSNASNAHWTPVSL